MPRTRRRYDSPAHDSLLVSALKANLWFSVTMFDLCIDGAVRDLHRAWLFSFFGLHDNFYSDIYKESSRIQFKAALLLPIVWLTVTTPLIAGLYLFSVVGEMNNNSKQTQQSAEPVVSNPADILLALGMIIVPLTLLYYGLKSWNENNRQAELGTAKTAIPVAMVVEHNATEESFTRQPASKPGVLHQFDASTASASWSAARTEETAESAAKRSATPSAPPLHTRVLSHAIA